MHVGVAGLGRMGAAMAARLAEIGYQVSGWNRSAEKAKPLAAAGVTIVDTPAALAAGADTIITSLTDATAIGAVYGGRDGLDANRLGLGGARGVDVVADDAPAGRREVLRDRAAHDAEPDHSHDSFCACCAHVCILSLRQLPTPARRGRYHADSRGENQRALAAPDPRDNARRLINAR